MTQKKFAILMATYNGESHLDEQLKSLEQQTEAEIDLWISDDGSTDRTQDLALGFIRCWDKGRAEFVRHERGQASFSIRDSIPSNENFRSLILNAEQEADYFAFCDQDDVWESDKLRHASDWLDRCDPDVPAMHFTRSIIIDAKGNCVGLSRLYNRPPAFSNALVQNIASGNTITMNRAAFKLMRETIAKGPFVVHDWWAYLCISAAGGRLCYSAEPKIRYRQHGKNILGDNRGLIAKWNRLGRVLAGQLTVWNDINLSLLEANREHMTPEAEHILERFKTIRKQQGLGGLNLLRKSEIHRQGIAEQCALYGACLSYRL